MKSGNVDLVNKGAIPQLVCTKKPSKNTNNGFYEVSIPLSYIIKAVEAPGANFVFKFIGMKYEK